MCRRVDPVKWADVSEDRIASIFRIEKTASEEPEWAVSSRQCIVKVIIVQIGESAEKRCNVFPDKAKHVQVLK
jgi:hypothetical protein